MIRIALKPVYLLFFLFLILFFACKKDRHEPSEPVNTSNLDQAQEFGVYLLQDDTLPLTATGEVDLENLLIKEEALLTLDDIEYYDRTGQTLHLKKAINWEDTGTPPYPPFLVAERGVVIQIGHFYFWPNCCWPKGSANFTVYNQNESVLLYSMQLHGEDKDTIVNALPPEYVRQDFITDIERAKVLEEKTDSIKVQFDIRVLNNSNRDLKLFNPAQAAAHIWELEFFPNENGYLVEYALSYQIYSYPEGHTPWSQDWYTSVAAGQTLSMSLTQVIKKPGDFAVDREIDILFYLDNLAGGMNQATFEASDPPVWLGRIIHRQKVLTE